MSYLDVPMLHFAGRFQADVPTANNLSGNFHGPVYDAGWNLDGGGSWRLDGCHVTGTSPEMSGDDAAWGARVLDAGDRVSAKIVDLDPDQQLVSQIWGLSVRITTSDGRLLATGSFAPAAFFDLWMRCPSATTGMGSLGAFYQSTLEDLRWGDVASSPLLTRLRACSPDRLSIKFNVDGFQSNPREGSFTFGRLVGTLGPAGVHEPRHFVAGRMLRGSGVFAPAILDDAGGRCCIDLGNALPTVVAGGPMAPAQTGLRLAAEVAGVWQPLGPLDAGDYEATAGVVELPLSDERRHLAAAGRLGVLDGDQVYLQESESRLYVRADQLVWRLDAGESAVAEFTVTDAGQIPAERHTIQLALGGQQLGARDPADGLGFASTVLTDDGGRAVVELHAGDLGSPRAEQGIDGQVYGVSWSLAKDPAPANEDGWDVLSVLVWDRYPEVEQPTWYEHVQPILTQYHHLYPVMARILDLSDYRSVLEHLDLVALSCNLPLTDPNHMPVTRDLSGAKHAMLSRWFAAPLLGRRAPNRAGRQQAVAASESAGLDVMTAIKSGQREHDA